MTRAVAGEALGRLLMALLFLVSASTKLTETAAIQAYMQTYGVPAILVWPAAAWEYVAGVLLLAGWLVRPVSVLLAGWCVLTAVIFHTRFSDLDQHMNFFKNMTMAGAFLVLALHGSAGASIDAVLASCRGTTRWTSRQCHQSFVGEVAVLAGKSTNVRRWIMRPTLLVPVVVLCVGFASASFAAGGGGGGGADTAASAFQSKPLDPNFVRAKQMIEARDYKGALPFLQQVVAKDPRNADAYNLMGYAVRSSGDPNGSLQYYQQALAIDPRHIGAHEYIGEAYLMLNRPAEAEQDLSRLDSLCIFGCTEYRMLKTAIANYKAGRRPTN